MPVFPRGGYPVSEGEGTHCPSGGFLSPWDGYAFIKGKGTSFFEGRLPHFRVRFTTLPRDGNP